MNPTKGLKCMVLCQNQGDLVIDLSHWRVSLMLTRATELQQPHMGVVCEMNRS